MSKPHIVYTRGKHELLYILGVNMNHVMMYCIYYILTGLNSAGQSGRCVRG